MCHVNETHGHVLFVIKIELLKSNPFETVRCMNTMSKVNRHVKKTHTIPDFELPLDFNLDVTSAVTCFFTVVCIIFDYFVVTLTFL